MGETRKHAEYLMARPMSDIPSWREAMLTGVVPPDMTMDERTVYILRKSGGIHDAVLMLADKIDELRIAAGIDKPQPD